MGSIEIPIRYYKDYAGAYEYGYETLSLDFGECAFLREGVKPEKKSVGRPKRQY